MQDYPAIYGKLQTKAVHAEISSLYVSYVSHLAAILVLLKMLYIDLNHIKQFHLSATWLARRPEQFSQEFVTVMGLLISYSVSVT